MQKINFALDWLLWILLGAPAEKEIQRIRASTNSDTIGESLAFRRHRSCFNPIPAIPLSIRTQHNPDQDCCF